VMHRSRLSIVVMVPTGRRNDFPGDAAEWS
jgi:hypothetical protein